MSKNETIADPKVESAAAQIDLASNNDICESQSNQQNIKGASVSNCPQNDHNESIELLTRFDNSGIYYIVIISELCLNILHSYVNCFFRMQLKHFRPFSPYIQFVQICS